MADVPYILITIIVLGVIFAIVAWKKRKDPRQLSVLGALSFGSVIAGIVFNENRLVGYAFLGIGIALAMADIFVKAKKNNLHENGS